MSLSKNNIKWIARLDTSRLKKDTKKARFYFKSIDNNVEGLNSGLKKTKKSTQQLGNQTKKSTKGMKAGFSSVAIGLGVAAMAFSRLTNVAKEYIDLYEAQMLAEKKLTTILKQRTGATDLQIQKILELTSAQQQLGVIGDEVQIQGAQQLGTFINQTDSLNSLIPAMNNLIAQQKGLDASGQDAVTIANLMGRAFQGQIGALTRVGISFSDAEGEILKYGTESERAAVLSKIITNNVGEMNKELAKTDAGRIQQAKNAIGDLKEEMGKGLMPVMATVYEAILNLMTGIKEMGGYFKETIEDITKSSEFQKSMKNFKDPLKELGDEVGVTAIAFESLDEKFIDLQKAGFEKFMQKLNGEVQHQMKIMTTILRIYKNIVVEVKSAVNWVKEFVSEQQQTEKYIEIVTKINDVVEDLKIKFQELVNFLSPATQKIADFFDPLLEKSEKLAKTIGIIAPETEKNIEKSSRNSIKFAEKIDKSVKVLNKSIKEIPTIDLAKDSDKEAKTIEDINKLKIEATKEGIDEELALLELSYVEKKKRYADNEEALKYLKILYKEEVDKIETEYNNKEIEKEQEKNDKLFEILPDSWEKRKTLIEKEYEKKLELAKGNAELTKKIEKEKNDALIEGERNFHKQVADEKLAAYEIEQEIALMRFQQNTLKEIDLQKFILTQQIENYNKKLENSKGFTEAEIELINLRKQAIQSELDNLIKSSSIISGIFEQVGKSFQDINTENIKSLKDFSTQLYKATKSNIKNYLAETIAVTIKESVAFSGNPIAGLIVAGIASTGVKLLFDNILPEVPKFEHGGIVGGNSYSGDKIYAGVNSEEMILTKKNQNNLWKLANNKGKVNSISMEQTNKLLLKQYDLLKNNKDYLQKDNTIIAINKVTGQIANKKIL